MAIEDLLRAMRCEIPTGSTVDGYSDSAVFEIPHGPKTRPKDFSGPDVLSIKAVRRPDQKPSSVDGIQTIPEIR